MWLSPLQVISASSKSSSITMRSAIAIQKRCMAVSSKSGQNFPSMPQGYKIRRFYKKVDVVQHPLTEEIQKLKAGESIDFKNLSYSSEPYWAVTLDGKVTKTMYKDNLLIPTKAMAVALAEEWEC